MTKRGHGGKGTIILILKGMAADAVTEALMRIDANKRLMVKGIIMDMSNSMRLIAKRCLPNAVSYTENNMLKSPMFRVSISYCFICYFVTNYYFS